MRAAVLVEPGRIIIEEREVPTPGPGEVLIKLSSVGVCGSDTHYYEHGRIADFVVREPLILGHESSGVIEAVGADVDASRVGQRVAIEPGIPCRSCEMCLTGHYNLCPQMRFHATPPIDGTLAEYVVHPAEFAFAVPDSISDDEAALLEPLSVGVWSCQKAHVGAGSRVLVTGAGPIGLVCTMVARAVGATDVTVVDINADRLAVAKEVGATRVVNAGETNLEAALAEGAAPTALLECTGHEATTITGINALAPSSWAILIGMGGDTVTLPLGAIQVREIMVTGTFRYANTWPTAIALVASGAVDLERLVTGHYGLEQSVDALTAARTVPGAIKSVIHPQR